MKSISKQQIAYSISILAAAILAACGGGGGDAPASPQSPTTAPVPTGVVTLPTPVDTYTAGGEQKNAFNLLNQERKNCGFGALTQNIQLDQSASAHAKFLVENSLNYGHNEAAGLPFFTGLSETERAAAAGYTGPVGAVLATASGPTPTDSSLRTTQQVRALLSAPYHLSTMVDSYAEVGVGFSQKQVPGNLEKRALNMTLGGLQGTNELADDQVYTYPCSGSSGVNRSLANETPNPIPLNLVQDYTKYGTPIVVKVRAGKMLKLTSVALTPAVGGSSIATIIVDQSNDPQRGTLMRTNTAYILPMVPLLPLTSYALTVSGASDGVIFTKTFAQPFTTGD
jgi:uncharacterized protein YkwD